MGFFYIFLKSVVLLYSWISVGGCYDIMRDDFQLC